MSALTMKTCDRYVLARQMVDKTDGYVSRHMVEI
jgi:hypothetical protein